MNNKSVFIIIFTLFFFNTTTECMLTRFSQLIATNGKNLTTKITTPAITQQDSSLLSNQNRNEQLTQVMKKAVEEGLARREKEDNIKKETLKHLHNVPSWNVAK